MGVIQRQGIKDSIVAYLGVALGAVNTLFIYTKLPDEVLGLFQFLVSNALIASMLLQLGMPNVALRFFPTFRTEDNRHNGLLGLLLLPILVGFIVFTIVMWLSYTRLQEWLVTLKTNPLAGQFLYMLLPLAFFMVLSAVLTQHIKNFYRIVVPTLLDNVWVKIATGTLSLLFVYGVLQVFGFVVGIVIAYGVVTVGLFAYLGWLGQLYLKPNFTVLDRPLLRSIGIFAFYGVLGSVGSSLMTYVDRTMITLLIPERGLDLTGIFSIVAYIGTTIDIPRKSLEKITAPVVANAIQSEDWTHVADLYRRTSINLLVVGSLLFLGIWLNLNSVFAIMANGEKYIPYKNIVFILGISSLLDMVTSINTHIIAYSRHFRFAFYVIIVLAGLNIIFNYLLIKTFGLGITGAALATMLSVFIFNLAKFFFIYWKFGLQPFTLRTLWVVLIGAGVFALASLLPSLGMALIDILYKSFIITILYITPILYFKLSTDLNDFLSKFWMMTRKRLNF